MAALDDDHVKVSVAQWMKFKKLNVICNDAVIIILGLNGHHAQSAVEMVSSSVSLLIVIIFQSKLIVKSVPILSWSLNGQHGVPAVFHAELD